MSKVSQAAVATLRTQDVHVWVLRMQNVKPGSRKDLFHCVLSLMKHKADERLGGCSFSTEAAQAKEKITAWREAFAFSNTPVAIPLDLEICVYRGKPGPKAKAIGRIIVPSLVQTMMAHAAPDPNNKFVRVMPRRMQFVPPADGEPYDTKTLRGMADGPGDLTFVITSEPLELADLSIKQLEPPRISAHILDNPYEEGDDADGADGLAESTPAGGSNQDELGAPPNGSTLHSRNISRDSTSRMGKRGSVESSLGARMGTGKRGSLITRDRLRSRLEMKSTLTKGQMQMLEDEKREAANEEAERAQTFTPEQRIKRAEKRANICAEIVSSEQSYIQGVEALVKFLETLQRINEENAMGITGEQLAALRSNVPTLLKFHNGLLGDLQQVVQRDSGGGAGGGDISGAGVNGGAGGEAHADTTVPSIFLKYVDYFKIYTTYVNGYQAMMDVHAELLRKVKKYAAWYQGWASGAGSDLLHFMIMPVQRVPRYVLLLAELRKVTHPNDPTFGDLRAALRRLRKVAGHINETQRHIENMAKLSELQSRIQGNFQVVEPHRRLLREGELMAMSKSGYFGTMKKFIFFLFNDVLVWTSQNFKFKGALKLAAASVDDLMGRGSSRKASKSGVYGFEVTTSKESMVLQFTSQGERDSWLDQITTAIAEVQEARKAARMRNANIKQRQRKVNQKKDAMHTLLTSQLKGLAVDADDEDEDALEVKMAQRKMHERQGSVQSKPYSVGEGGAKLVASGSGFKVRQVARRR